MLVRPLPPVVLVAQPRLSPCESLLAQLACIEPTAILAVTLHQQRETRLPEPMEIAHAVRQLDGFRDEIETVLDKLESLTPMPFPVEGFAL